MNLIQTKVVTQQNWIDLDQLPVDSSVLVVTVKNPNDAGGGYQCLFIATTWTKVRTTQLGDGNGCLETWVGEGPFAPIQNQDHPNGIRFSNGRQSPLFDAVCTENG